jgi:nitroreductase
MNRVSDFLLNRHSVVNLQDPAPDKEIIARLFAMSMRVPDHAQLKPCRWLVFEGEARLALGEIFREATVRVRPDATDDQLERCLKMPLRAPLLIAVVASLVPNAKVPEIEQLLSVGCSAFAIVLGLEAEGFGGVWRTGELCYDSWVAEQLGLRDTEKLVGFIYAGSPDPAAKVRAPTIPAMEDRLYYWPAPEKR